MKNKLDRIIKNELCLGCGLCESIGKEHNYKMELRTNGFYYPKLPGKRVKYLEKEMSKVCPGVNIIGDNSKKVWGNITQSFIAWSNDPEIRIKGSSGGIITSICVYLLENKIVNGILHVGKEKEHYLFNRLYISRNRAEVLSNSSSRYAPALVLNELTQILNISDEIYCFVGKPCDILTVKNYLKIHPEYENRIKYFIALFCAGIPSYNATLKLIQKASIDEEPLKIQYRGDGWPGLFKATYKDNFEFKVSYDDSWGKVLGRQVHFRCKICPDSIGLLADISVGDAWETKNGVPNFEEKPGKSFILIRNEKANLLFQQIISSETVVSEKFDLEMLSAIQPYQYNRRLIVGYRIYPIHIISGFLLNLNKLNLTYLMRKSPLVKGIRNMIGVIRRSSQRNSF